MSEDTFVKTKAPQFSGLDEDWDDWTTLLFSDLQQLGCANLLLALEEDKEIPKDGEKTDADGETLRKLNMKAFARLLQCMNVKEEMSKVAFHIVQDFQDKDSGYSHGNFCEAFKALEDIYNDEGQSTKVELKKLYNSKMMGYSEHPGIFITEMSRLRKKLSKVGAVMLDEEFLSDIIAKLPGPRNRKDQDGP